MTPPTGAGAAPVVHLVVPAEVDDPRRPSGGNVYDVELSRALADLGRVVRRHRVGPMGATVRARELVRVLGALPDDALVVVDGLLASGAEDVLATVGCRLALVLLVHLPTSLRDDRVEAAARERRVLEAAAGVVTTSAWSRGWLAARHPDLAERISVARPGVRPADLARPTPAGASLTCVASLVPAKGQDVLVAALAGLGEDRCLDWSVRVVGSTVRDPVYAARVRSAVRGRGLADRVRFTGALGRGAVAASLADTDLLVLPTRLEVYGMVVTEALARGVPVCASEVGGVAEALGRTVTGEVPGLLVPPDDPAALAAALRAWLTDAHLRCHLRAAAASRRTSLEPWSGTARAVDAVLRRVVADGAHPRSVVRGATDERSPACRGIPA